MPISQLAAPSEAHLPGLYGYQQQERFFQEMEQGEANRALTQAQTASLQAGLELKLQEVQKFQEDTDRRLAETALATERANTDLARVGLDDEAKRAQLNTVIDEYMQQQEDKDLDELAVVADLADSDPVMMDQIFTTIIEQGENPGETFGMTAEQFMAMVPEQRQAMMRLAAARRDRTQQQRQAEQMVQVKEGLLSERQEAYQLRQHIHEMDLQSARLAAARQEAEQKADLKQLEVARAEISGKDLGQESPDNMRQSAMLQITGGMPLLFDEMGEDQDDFRMANEVANDVMERARTRMDADIQIWNRTRLTDPNAPFPGHINDYFQLEIEEAVGRIGTDEKYYKFPTKEFNEQKQNWMSSAANDPSLNANPTWQDLKTKRDRAGQQLILEMLWKNPAAREFARGAD